MDCLHPYTVEIYRGIFKCSSCGDVWDEATEGEKETRREGIKDGQRLQRKRAARVRRYKRRRR